MGQYCLEVERVAGCHAKVQHIGKFNGEPLSPTEILAVIEGGAPHAK
jgi:hypothetical protein